MSDFITCENNQITDEQLVAALLTQDTSGNWALRTMIVDACAEDALDCNTKDMTLSQMLRKCVGVNDCGKPAIRLAHPDLYNLLD